MKKIKYINKIDEIEGLSNHEKTQLKTVTERFAFRSNEYYLSLIDWSDPDDPIRQLIFPQVNELMEWGKCDPSEESNYTVIPGLQHKYPSTALLLVSNVCGGICRYCFRKRIFFKDNSDVLKNLPKAISYLKDHKEITNVLLTGGDPLMVSTRRLSNIIEQIAEIDHIKIVRIGTKMLSFNPYRILNDPLLTDMITKYNNRNRRIYIMSHFSHVREITEEAYNAIIMLQKAGAIILNQTPIIKKVNDSPLVLAELFQKMSFIGITPYYVFQCRPSLGNKIYAVPLEEAYGIFEKAREQVSGISKRARFVMSHSTGKLEIIGLTESQIYLKYHRAADSKYSAQFMIYKRNPEAYWYDDYTGLFAESSVPCDTEVNYENLSMALA